MWFYEKKRENARAQSTITGDHKKKCNQCEYEIYSQIIKVSINAIINRFWVIRCVCTSAGVSFAPTSTQNYFLSNLISESESRERAFGNMNWFLLLLLLLSVGWCHISHAHTLACTCRWTKGNVVRRRRKCVTSVTVRMRVCARVLLCIVLRRLLQLSAYYYYYWRIMRIPVSRNRRNLRLACRLVSTFMCATGCWYYLCLCANTPRPYSGWQRATPVTEGKLFTIQRNFSEDRFARCILQLVIYI